MSVFEKKKAEPVVERSFEPKQEVKSEVKSEVKQEVKQEIKTEVKIQQNNAGPSTLIAANPIDIYVTQMAGAQTATLQEIEVRDFTRKDGQHRLALPREVETLFKQKDYAARWIFKSKRALDNAIRDRGWALATRVYFPDLPGELFSATGVIEKGDCILGFMPEKRAKKLREAPGIASMEKVKNLPVEKWKNDEKGEKFYKPSLSAEKDGELVTSGVQVDI